MPKRADNPFKSDYFPELEMSPVLGPDEASHHHSSAGVMRWMIEIGKIYINIKVPYYHHTEQC